MAGPVDKPDGFPQGPPPKASVLMITFNHAKFIAQALESALDQVTSFDYEIVIGDDCSTDGTREIVQRYRNQYPTRIKLRLHAKNLGGYGKNNFIDAFFQCRGEYIALLEGDDYWLSPHKLQKQIEFLDCHPDFSVCFHPSLCVNDDGTPLAHFTDSAIVGAVPQKEFYTLEDLLQGDFMPTQSVVLRAGLVRVYPQWFFVPRRSDWLIFVLHAEQGYIGRIDEVMGAYRIHAEGIWTSMDAVEQVKDSIVSLEMFNAHFEYRYAELIRHVLSREYCSLGGVRMLRGEWPQAAYALTKSFMMSPFNRFIDHSTILKQLLKKGLAAWRKFLRASLGY